MIWVPVRIGQRPLTRIPSSQLPTISRHFQYAISISCNFFSLCLTRVSSCFSCRNNLFLIYVGALANNDLEGNGASTNLDFGQDPVLLLLLCLHFLYQRMIFFQFFLKDPLEPLRLHIPGTPVREPRRFLHNRGANIVLSGDPLPFCDKLCAVISSVIQIFKERAE